MNFPGYMQPMQAPQLQDFNVDATPLMQAWQMGVQLREQSRAKASVAPTEKDPKAEKLDGTIGELNGAVTALSQIQSVKNKIYQDNGGNADLMALDPRNNSVAQLEKNIYAQAPLMKRKQDLQGKYTEHIKTSGAQFNQQAWGQGSMGSLGQTYGDTASVFENSSDWETSTKGYNLEHSTAGQKVMDDFLGMIDHGKAGHTKQEAGKYSTTMVDAIRIGNGSGQAMVTQGGGGGMGLSNANNINAQVAALGITSDVQHAFWQSYMAEKGKGQMGRKVGKVTGDGMDVFREYDNAADAYTPIKDKKGNTIGQTLKADAALYSKDGKPNDLAYRELGDFINNKISKKAASQLVTESRGADRNYSIGHILTPEETAGNPNYGLHEQGLNEVLAGAHTQTIQGSVSVGSMDDYAKQMTEGSTSLEAFRNYIKEDPYLSQNKAMLEAKHGVKIDSPAFFKIYMNTKAGGSKSHEEMWNSFAETGSVRPWNNYIEKGSPGEWIRGEIAAGRLTKEEAYSDKYKEKYLLLKPEHARAYYGSLKPYDVARLTAENQSHLRDYDIVRYGEYANNMLNGMLKTSEETAVKDKNGYMSAQVSTGGKFMFLGKEIDGALLQGTVYKRNGSFGSAPAPGIQFSTKMQEFVDTSDPKHPVTVRRQIIDIDNSSLLPKGGLNPLATEADQKMMEDTWLYLQQTLESGTDDQKRWVKSNMGKFAKTMPKQMFSDGEMLIPVKNLPNIMSGTGFSHAKNVAAADSMITDEEAINFKKTNAVTKEQLKAAGFKETMPTTGPGYVTTKATPSLSDIKRVMVLTGKTKGIGGVKDVISPLEDQYMQGESSLKYESGTGKDFKSMDIPVGMNSEAMTLLQTHHSGGTIVKYDPTGSGDGEFYLKVSTRLTSPDMLNHTRAFTEGLLRKQNQEKSKTKQNKSQMGPYSTMVQ